MLSINLLQQRSGFCVCVCVSERTFQRYTLISIGGFSVKGEKSRIYSVWQVKTAGVQVKRYSQGKRKTFYLILNVKGHNRSKHLRDWISEF